MLEKEGLDVALVSDLCCFSVNSFIFLLRNTVWGPTGELAVYLLVILSTSQSLSVADLKAAGLLKWWHWDKETIVVFDIEFYLGLLNGEDGLELWYDLYLSSMFVSHWGWWGRDWGHWCQLTGPELRSGRLGPDGRQTVRLNRGHSHGCKHEKVLSLSRTTDKYGLDGMVEVWRKTQSKVNFILFLGDFK